MRAGVFVAVVIASATLVAQRANAPADAWPHWRGPAHNGVAPGSAPIEWSETKNVAWKVAIPGRGHSTPVI